jgi:hypothetical protein
MSNVHVVKSESYCIIFAFDEDAPFLVEKVQHYLDKGWSISGGIASLNSKLYQTMIKR